MPGGLRSHGFAAVAAFVKPPGAGPIFLTGQLARALIHDPPIMLLDEPTRGLDVFGTQTIFDYIARLREQGKAVIVSTHRLHEAQGLCDRFGLLHKGRLSCEGSLAELQEQTGRESISEMFMQFVHQVETGSADATSTTRSGK